MKTSIIDQPRKGGEKDLFDIDGYRKALSLFIENADTPITIALQGEWGSGKTSLMNCLQYNLAQEQSPFYSIWINTWQYSLLNNPQIAIVEILNGIILKLISCVEPDRKKQLLTQCKPYLATAGKLVGNIFGNIVGAKEAGNIIADTLKNANEDNHESAIANLRKQIEKLIVEILESGSASTKKKGILFFIDDLDRIDPPVAVQILELLKNIFDLEHCIFILAIDYDVVIKGLKPKFGEMTAKNEREFRSFFDKIIQLPFAMPVSSYQIDAFLIDALHNIQFLTDSEVADEKLTTELSEFAMWSVGSNPRSLKRLTNTLSLIKLIAYATKSPEDDQDFQQRKSINFALVCMQICYPAVYNALLLEPDFQAWGNSLAQKLSLDALSEDELEKLCSQEGLDKEWEQTLFRLCRKDYFLSSRFLDISRLLNKISTLIPEAEHSGEVIAATIRLSAVTNLQSSVEEKAANPIDFSHAYWLKTHRDRLIPKVNALLGDWGKLLCDSSRVKSNVCYKIEQANHHNRSSYKVMISHDGKQYLVHWEKSFGFLSGNSTGDIDKEEEAIGQSGTFQRIKNELKELSDQYHVQHDVGCGPGIPNCGSNIWFNFAYDSLEEAVSEEAVGIFAEFVVAFLKITDQFALISQASSAGQLEKMWQYYKNNGILPFKKLGIWKKNTHVLDLMSYKGNELSLDITLQPKSFHMVLWVRHGDCNVMPEILQKANLTDSFPVQENQCWVNDISFDEIESFMGDTLKKLSSLQATE